jgi:hypothetical protein
MPFNPITIVWKEIEGEAKIQRIFLSTKRMFATELVEQIYSLFKIGSCLQINEIADKIVWFLNETSIVGNGRDLIFF